MIDYTTTGLVNAIKLRAMSPDSQSLLTPSRILSIANDVQYAMVVPWMMSQRQDFFKTFVDIPINPSTQVYQLPKNTVGEKIVAIFYGKDSSQPGQIDWDACAQIDIGDSYDKDFRTRRPFSYFISSDTFTVWPAPQDPSKFFRVWYYRRPNFLVTVEECGRIDSINTGTNTVAAPLAPSSWNASTELDFVQGRPHFSLLGTKTPISYVVSSDLGSKAYYDFVLDHPFSGHYQIAVNQLNFNDFYLDIPENVTDELTYIDIANAVNASTNARIAGYVSAIPFVDKVRFIASEVGLLGNSINIDSGSIPGDRVFLSGGTDAPEHPSNTVYTPTFSSLPTGLLIGDYLCETGSTCVPQLPFELWPFLIHGSVVQILKILGNPSWQIAEQELQRTMSNARAIIGPRADEESKKLVSGWW